MKKNTVYDSIVAFGDSMSDNGSTNGHGFQTYSNGRVWVEYLAEFLTISKVDVRAWGGAFSGLGNYNDAAGDWSGLQWQVNQYTSVDSLDNTLFTVEIGINDLHDPATKITPEDVVNNIQSALVALVEKGARHFLVWNLPESLDFPAYTDPQYESFSYYAPLIQVYKDRFREFNRLITPALELFEEKHQDVTIRLFDLNRTMAELIAKFENSSTPWSGTYEYPEKNKYMWWDHWHIMTDTHRLIAESVVNELQTDNL